MQENVVWRIKKNQDVFWQQGCDWHGAYEEWTIMKYLEESWTPLEGIMRAGRHKLRWVDGVVLGVKKVGIPIRTVVRRLRYMFERSAAQVGYGADDNDPADSGPHFNVEVEETATFADCMNIVSRSYFCGL